MAPTYQSNVFRSSNKNPRQKIQNTKDPTYGIFMGEVVANKDISRTGRLKVYVPALAQDKQTSTGYFEAVWSSPFAGSTDSKAVGKELENPTNTMQSYGMWMIPPDLGNHVLVAFGDGNMKYPVIISCLYQDKFNNMVPGLPYGNNFQVDAFQMPTLEKNKRSEQQGHNQAFRPIAHTLSEAVTKQGLIFDNVRGPTSSGARRESPSEVFGILTPGPRDPNNYDYRLGGHQFVMDDSLTNRQVRIRSAQGNQVLLDDNEGMIYFINKSGRVWMEMTGSGQLVLYADTEITMRTKGDFNVRADRNINLEAGQDVNIKAAGDTVNDGATGTEYAGPGQLGSAPTGVGGNFIVESQNETRFVSSASILGTSASGDIQFNAAGEFNSTAGNDVNIKSSGGSFFADASATSHIKAGSDVNITSGGNINENSGGQIMMNSGGASASPAKNSQSISSIATNSFNDEPYGEIIYDPTKEDPLDGKGGVRTGDAPAIQTITSNFITLEPWIGHNISDPRDQIEKPAVPPPATVANNTSPASPLDPDSPADVNTPEGFVQGDTLTGQTPTYVTAGNASSNWEVPAQKTIGPEKVSQVVTALNASLPPIRSATMTADQTKIIGSQTRIEKGIGEADLIGIDFAGRKANTTTGQLAELKSNINRAKLTSATESDYLENLEQAGITVYPEGNTIVYTDPNGNSIRDVTSGNINDETNYNLVQAEFLAEKERVAQLTSVPLSDNQLSALTSMSMQVGFDNMSGSSVISELNNESYATVPNAFLDYSFAQTPSGPLIKADYRDRRLFEAELFQTPDNIPLPAYGTKSVPWAQQARDLRKARKMYTSVLNQAETSI
jgi:GH24 family phage-related lysozyme (muramidase)/uncharacterized protein (DUF2345 family)